MGLTAGELVTEALEYDGGRLVTVYVPPEPAEAVVFAADGGWHLPRLSGVLEGAGAPSTMIVGVHGLPDDDGRLHEYVPGFDAQRFAAHERFFVDDVGRWVASRFGVALPAARTGVWGASLGGELALAMGLRHPDVFGAVLAASPGAGFQPPEELPSLLPRVYLVAGRQEQFFLDNATRWADALCNAEADVAMMQRDGEHGGAFWGEEFPLMLVWAFGH
jgi:enterochelin esterase-like enzyme